MAEQPKLDQIAQAVNVSVRHLRRLFWQARRESPQTAFTRLRLERAMGLLSLSNLKLDAIARQCGFSSSSDFCRVFKIHHHMSPDAWRKHRLPAYRGTRGHPEIKPVRPDAAADFHQHRIFPSSQIYVYRVLVRLRAPMHLFVEHPLPVQPNRQSIAAAQIEPRRPARLAM